MLTQIEAISAQKIQYNTRLCLTAGVPDIHVQMFVALLNVFDSST